MKRRETRDRSSMLLTTLERRMSCRNFENHRTLLLRVIDTRLRAEMRIGHLRCLEAHEAEVLCQTKVWQRGESIDSLARRKWIKGQRTSYVPMNNNRSNDVAGWYTPEPHRLQRDWSVQKKQWGGKRLLTLRGARRGAGLLPLSLRVGASCTGLATIVVCMRPVIVLRSIVAELSHTQSLLRSLEGI